MPEDEKLAFYLRHREQIEEWASLRSHAEDALNAELWESARRLALELPEDGVLLEKRWGYEHVFIPAAVELPSAGVGLAWKKSGLIGAGPTLAVTCLDGRNWHHYEALKAATQSVGLAHGLAKFGAREWLWKAQLRPPAGLMDLSGFATECLDRLQRVWADVAPRVESMMKSV